jgi:prepilin-type N-terminal cleavage/methylation domain-containing protein
MLKLQVAVLGVETMKTRVHAGHWRAFTLVEVMVVVAVIGLLVALVLPSFAKAREQSKISAMTEQLRMAYAAFQEYAIDYGTYPPDVNRGVTPSGMSGYLGTLNWAAPTALGATWDWDANTEGVTAGISMVPPTQPTLTDPEYLAVDKAIDDGNLSTGAFIMNGNRYTYIVEP